MNNFIEIAKEKVPQLENALKQVDEFLENVPQGSLKWQNKNGKTYYYHQFMKDNKWVRRYIKKAELSLAKTLAQKHYYISIRHVLAKILDEMKCFTKKCPLNELEKIYDNLSVERKCLVMPIQVSVNEKLKQWENEVYEKNLMYPDNLRYETEQGDVVRSKSEVIIANILYQNRKDIVYKYECPLEVIENGHKKIIYPDFTIMNVHTGKITYFEHAGLMDDSNYATEFVKKINTYIANGILPGKDVEVTYETSAVPLDISVVKRLINEMANVE